MYPPNRIWKRWISNKKLAKLSQAKWQNCAAWSAGTPHHNTLPHNSFNVKFSSQGMPAEHDVQIGSLVITWYITFRGRRLPGPHN